MRSPGSITIRSHRENGRAIIEVEELSKAFRSRLRRRSVQAVFDLNLRVEGGDARLAGADQTFGAGYYSRGRFDQPGVPGDRRGLATAIELGHRMLDRAFDELEQTLEEEKATDEKLTKLAEGWINQAAANARPAEAGTGSGALTANRTVTR